MVGGGGGALAVFEAAGADAGAAAAVWVAAVWVAAGFGLGAGTDALGGVRVAVCCAGAVVRG
jgi:demethoxyubiquinone hydroxylase (CLK1/Coq7/Cat5 family)